jgi:hypothetical protein
MFSLSMISCNSTMLIASGFCLLNVEEEPLPLAGGIKTKPLASASTSACALDNFVPDSLVPIIFSFSITSSPVGIISSNVV